MKRNQKIISKASQCVSDTEPETDFDVDSQKQKGSDESDSDAVDLDVQNSDIDLVVSDWESGTDSSESEDNYKYILRRSKQESGLEQGMSVSFGPDDETVPRRNKAKRVIGIVSCKDDMSVELQMVASPLVRSRKNNSCKAWHSMDINSFDFFFDSEAAKKSLSDTCWRELCTLVVAKSDNETKLLPAS